MVANNICGFVLAVRVCGYFRRLQVRLAGELRFGDLEEIDG